LELNDGRIIFHSNCEIIVLSLNSRETNIDLKIRIGSYVCSIMQLKNNLIVYATYKGIIEIISLKKNSYESIQKINDESEKTDEDEKEDIVIKLVELNDLNFVAIMKHKNIKLYEKKNNKYENTITMNCELESEIEFLGGIESSLDKNLFVISNIKFIFVDIYNKKILNELNIIEKEKEKSDIENEEENNNNEIISDFKENCIRYNNTIIVAGMLQIHLIDCIKMTIIKHIKIEEDNYPCITLTKFVGETFVTGDGFGEMMQYKLNKNGDDLIIIDKGEIYLEGVTTNVYSRCGIFIIGESSGLVMLKFE
jgi:hypothetical protein